MFSCNDQESLKRKERLFSEETKLVTESWRDRIETCSLSDFTTKMEPPW